MRRPLPSALAGHEALLLPRLLWAASHDRQGPAIAAGRLQLLTVLEAGTLLYDPRAHALRPVCAIDLRIPREPNDPPRGFELVYVATMTRGDGGTRRAVAAIDAATVGARVERLCAACGLWLNPRGPLEARALEICLGLDAPRFVSYIQSIGWTDELPPPLPGP
jgi:hypothetical protein